MGKVVLILTVTCAGLGLLSLHLVKQLRDGTATIAELRTQVASLEERVAAVPAVAPPPAIFTAIEQPSEAAPEPAPRTAPVPAPQSAAEIAAMVSSPPTREERIRMMREHRERQRQLMQDPEYREAMRMQSRSNLARQYPGVIQELGLDSQQAEEFFNMLADQQMRSSEQMEPLWEADMAEKPDPAAFQERHRKIQQAASENQRRNEAELASRFGQGTLVAWKDYQSTVGQRYQLENMRSTLAAQGLPLSEDVSKPMLKALAAAQKAEMDEYSAAVSRGAAGPLGRMSAQAAFDNANNMEQQIERTKKRNQRTLDAVSSYLSFEQRSALEKEQDAQLKMMEAQSRIMRARGTPGANGIYSDGASQLILAQ
ncbi:MAG: hypothetical protein SXG53_22410 [Pseudomonadota bacterium]|nr:hypothetical protein [Pseudomonadota bacterium]